MRFFQKEGFFLFKRLEIIDSKRVKKIFSTSESKTQ